MSIGGGGGGGGGGGIGGSASLSTSFGDIGGGLFGAGSSQSTAKSETSATSTSSTERSKTVLSSEALSALIQDALGQSGGLAAIFAEEQGAGLFGSTTAKQSAADLASDLVSEIAKLTSDQVTEEDEAGVETTASSETVSNERDNFFEALLSDGPF